MDSPFAPGSNPTPAPPAVQQTIVVHQAAPQSQALPALASFLCFPGLGQLIQGRVVAAMLWWLLSFFAGLSCLFVVGFVLVPVVWIACTIDAARYNPSDPTYDESTHRVLGIVATIFGGLIVLPILVCSGVRMFAPPPSPTAFVEPPARSIELPPLESTPARSPADSQAAVPLAEEVEPESLEAMPAELPEIEPESMPEPEPFGPRPIPGPTGPTAAELEAEAREEAERLEAIRLEKIDAAKWRTWTSAGGTFSVEAKFISLAAGLVTLERRDGRVITVELAKLSPGDETFIRSKAWEKAGN